MDSRYKPLLVRTAEAKRASIHPYQSIQVYVRPGQVQSMSYEEYQKMRQEASTLSPAGFASPMFGKNPYTKEAWVAGEEEYVNYQGDCYARFPVYDYESPLDRRELLYEWSETLLPARYMRYLTDEQIREIEAAARCFLRLDDFNDFLVDFNRKQAEEFVQKAGPGAFVLRTSSAQVLDPDIQMYVLTYNKTDESRASIGVEHQLFVLHRYLGIVLVDEAAPENLVPGDANWNRLYKQHWNSIVELLETTLSKADPSNIAWQYYLVSRLSRQFASYPCLSMNNAADCKLCREDAPEKRRCQARCEPLGQRCSRYALPHQTLCLQHKEQQEQAERQRYKSLAQRQGLPEISSYAQAAPPTPLPQVTKEKTGFLFREVGAEEGFKDSSNQVEILDDTHKDDMIKGTVKNMQEAKMPADLLKLLQDYVNGTRPDISIRLFAGTRGRESRDMRVANLQTGKFPWSSPRFLQVYKNGVPDMMIRFQRGGFSTNVEVLPPVPAKPIF